MKDNRQKLYRYSAKKIDGRRIDEHRYLMEQYLGRKLHYDEVVHHINGDKFDNRIENLVIMTRSEHTKLHLTGVKITEETKQKLRDIWANKIIKNSKRVACYDKDTGKFLKEYLSITKAAKDGHVRHRIVACCRGVMKSHHGLIWKYI